MGANRGKRALLYRHERATAGEQQQASASGQFFVLHNTRVPVLLCNWLLSHSLHTFGLQFHPVSQMKKTIVTGARHAVAAGTVSLHASQEDESQRMSRLMVQTPAQFQMRILSPARRPVEHVRDTTMPMRNEIHVSVSMLCMRAAPLTSSRPWPLTSAEVSGDGG